jgi:hypothetical protein
MKALISASVTESRPISGGREGREAFGLVVFVVERVKLAEGEIEAGEVAVVEVSEEEGEEEGRW